MIMIKSTAPYPEVIYRRFTELLKKRFTQEKQLGRLKQFTHYYATLFTYGHYLAGSVQTSTSVDQAMERADQFFANNSIKP